MISNEQLAADQAKCAKAPPLSDNRGGRAFYQWARCHCPVYIAEVRRLQEENLALEGAMVLQAEKIAELTIAANRL